MKKISLNTKCFIAIWIIFFILLVPLALILSLIFKDVQHKGIIAFFAGVGLMILIEIGVDIFKRKYIK